MVGEQNSRVAYADTVFVVWIEDRMSHNIPLSQSLIQSKALTLLYSVEAERWEGAAEEKLDAGRGQFMRFKERHCLHNMEEQGGVASCPGEPAKMVKEGGCSEYQLSRLD